MREKILVGETDDELVEVEYEVRDNGEISFSGQTYEKDFFDNDAGESRAREYVEGDDEAWKSAVASDQTKQGFDDWAEDYLSSVDWMEILGDIHETKDGLYTQSKESGQIDMNIKKDSFTKTFIPKEKVEEIWDAWEEYHFKKSTPRLRAKMNDIFKKYNSSISDYNTETEKVEYRKKMYA